MNKPVTPERTKQLRHLIEQSFETFNIYGRTPESLTSILSAFSLALSDCETVDITEAFKFWLRENSAMPTPADIRKIAVEYAKDRRAATQKAQPAPRVSGRAVPWYGLSWKEINHRGMVPQVEQHLIELTRTNGKERAAEYLNYLKTGPQNKKQ